MGSLEEALAQFTAYEVLDGANRCTSYQKAQKKLMILEGPNILTVVVKRLQSDNFGKLSKPINFPKLLVSTQWWIAWLVDWALVLDYTIGGSTIARGITPNLASFFGGLNKLPVFLARQTIPGVGIVVDPCAALLIMITILLCFGIKELARQNGLDMIFRVVFFSYIGFDTVTSTAEEVKNPQRDLPLGIGIALLICCILCMLLSVFIVGLVPYYSLNPDTPVSSAFGDSGMQWAAYILTTGAITAQCASLLGSFLAQPRSFMAMARDGLLPAFFAEISPRTQVPVKSTIAIGVLAAALAFSWMLHSCPRWLV
ncbi:Papain-like cysteine peptidase superfamily [Arabidopsis thaliana x Arabidopsis arenosa]|uniref:Papain-like cysteine peptidase superfamily n=1 Tax=Arabidopsis thaliana x Arabidopsis arenosa TaxID=1240361 RepID=A0A8T1YTG7_9BRAS|nr:Papain-like cysteine peptidase superfamily [Arabidopsis thaliana x Arabidopsis arenosa]